LVLTLSPLRPFDAAYRQFVEVVASTIGSDLDRTRRRNDTLGEQRHISETLQAAMLRPASDLPTVAARYVPASDDMFVGGDWYDVVDLPSERRGIVVGDCVGHGLVAATAMSQLRSAARALLLDGREPAEVVSGLDVFAESVPEAMCTTVVVAIFDRTEESMTYCRAGHLPPLIAGRDGVRWLDAVGGTPLGIDPNQDRKSSTIALDQDDLIVMFTDGLVERRGEVIDEGLDRLAAMLPQMTELDVQGVADGILARLVQTTPADDVVLVVKRLQPTPQREAAG
jgi:serine phosphatase RsbU (regulator of sigma subunit)